MFSWPILTLLSLSSIALASLHPSPPSKMHVYRRQSASSSPSRSASDRSTVSSVSTIFVTTGARTAPAAVTTAPQNGNTIVIVFSTAGAPSAAPSNATLSPSAGASNISLSDSTLSSSSSSISSASTPSAVFSTFTPAPTGTPSASASALPQAKDDTIAGLSKGGFTGLVVGLVLAAILLLVAAFMGIRYLRGSRERKEWEAYQNLSGMNGSAYVGDAGSAAYGEDEMSEAGRVPGQRESAGMMMRVHGASELGAPGERGSVVSERWQRSQY